MRPLQVLYRFHSLQAVSGNSGSPLSNEEDRAYNQQKLPNEVRLDDAHLNRNDFTFPSQEAEMDSQRPDSENSGSQAEGREHVESHQEMSETSLQSRPEPLARPEPEAQAETREERLARIRREIEEGTYETPEKLEIALSRMFGSIAE